MFALDTNSIIHLFKGDGRLQQQVAAHAPHDFHIPTLVLYEIEVGSIKANYAPKRKLMSEFIELCQIIPFTPKEALAAAHIRIDLEKRGEVIGPLDILIAACALANGLTLITHHTQEFRRIKDLRLEDWY